MSVSFQKSLEAREGMRETLEAAETFAPVAAPIATAARVVGNVAAAVITPVVNNVCNFNSETAAFCKGFIQPAKDLAERMAAVPDSLKTEYGFSEEEAKRFHEATGDVFTAAAVAIPFVKTTSLRVSHKVKYGAMNDSFIGEPKEYWGTLKRDLILVRFGREMDSGFKTTVWWTTPHEINPLATMEKVEEYAAILSLFGKKTHVTLAKIPAGEPIRFLHGRAAPQVAFDPFEFKLGGMVQYQFYDFDPKWICKTEPLIKPPSGVFWTRRMIVAPIISDEDDLVEKTRDISPASYFKYAKIEIQPKVVPDLHEEGDCITEALNRMSIEEQAAREFEREIGEFCGYLRGQAESEDRARDRVRLQGALSDAALAALRFGAPRLGALFQAGHEMIRFEESVRRVQGVGSFASMDGALAIGSVAGTGMAVIGAFASLDRESEDVFGPLMQGMRKYNALLCGQVQEICRQVAYFHAETMWEFGRVRNELFSMYEELKAVQMQVTKEAEFLKQDVTIGFLRVQREFDLFRKEIGYQAQELRLEELRQVEDGINHYEFGTVSLDKVRGWASVIERWMANPPFKKIMIGRTIGFLAEAAKAKGVVEIEEASMDALINLDTLEALLPAYATVLKMLREEGFVYDSEGVLWQKMVLDPVNACEAVSNKLEEKRTQIETAFADNAELLHAFREHFISYKAQIARIRRSAQEKKDEIKAMPCVMRSAEKFSRAAAKLDESEGLLADKLQALIAALAARK